jgi:hypothetical protein
LTGIGLYPETQVGYGYNPLNDTLVSVVSASADHTQIMVRLPASALVQGTTLAFYASTPGERGTTPTNPAPILTVVNPSPTITSITPPSLSADSVSSFLLTVNGANFVPGSTLYWNGEYFATTYVSSTQVTAFISGYNLDFPGPDTVPPGPVTVSVVNAAPGGGTASATQTFTNGPYPAPTLTAINPDVVAPGAGVYMTLTGADFLHHSVIQIGSQSFSLSTLQATLSDDRTQISFFLPTTSVPPVGVYPVTVTNPAPGGGTSAAQELIVSSTPVPPIGGDFGFETPVVGAGRFQYAPSGSPWAFAGGAGITGSASAFGNPPAPQGQQAALVQGGGATIAQSVPGWQTGTSYTLTVDAAQRSFHGTNTQSVRVLLDGAALGTITPTGTGYAPYTVGPFTTTAGAHTLSFAGLNPQGGDNTAFLDNVQINVTPAPPATPTGLDFGFETPVVGGGKFQYGPSGSPWAFVGGAGIAGNASAFGNPPAPEGQQTAFVQQTGSLSQPVAGWQAGTRYTLTLDAAQRSFHGANTQSIQVSVGGQAVGTVTPTSTGYAPYSLTFTAPTSGTLALAFTGLNPQGGDNTAFLDNVQVTQ